MSNESTTSTGSSLEEVIEVPSEWCFLEDTETSLRCEYGRGNVDCAHPLRASRDSVGCSDRNVMFLKRIDYLNWKMSGGKHE